MSVANAIGRAMRRVFARGRLRSASIPLVAEPTVLHDPGRLRPGFRRMIAPNADNEWARTAPVDDILEIALAGDPDAPEEEALLAQRKRLASYAVPFASTAASTTPGYLACGLGSSVDPAKPAQQREFIVPVASTISHLVVMTSGTTRHVEFEVRVNGSAELYVTRQAAVYGTIGASTCFVIDGEDVIAAALATIEVHTQSARSQGDMKVIVFLRPTTRMGALLWFTGDITPLSTTLTKFMWAAPDSRLTAAPSAAEQRTSAYIPTIVSGDGGDPIYFAWRKEKAETTDPHVFDIYRDGVFAFNVTAAGTSGRSPVSGLGFDFGRNNLVECRFPPTPTSGGAAPGETTVWLYMPYKSANRNGTMIQFGSDAGTALGESLEILRRAGNGAGSLAAPAENTLFAPILGGIDGGRVIEIFGSTGTGAPIDMQVQIGHEIHEFVMQSDPILRPAMLGNPDDPTDDEGAEDPSTQFGSDGSLVLQPGRWMILQVGDAQGLVQAWAYIE